MAGYRKNDLEHIPQWAINIRVLREFHNESQTDLAIAVNSSRAQISRYERYEREDTPTEEMFQAIADHFGVLVESLKNEIYTPEFLSQQEERMEISDLVSLGLPMYLRTTSKAARNNAHFLNATEYLDRIEKTATPMKGMIQRCKEEFYKSFKEDKILAGAANTLLVIILEFCHLAMPQDFAIKLQDGLVKRKDMDAECYKQVKMRSRLKEEFLHQNEEIFDECLGALRKESASSHLADYYLALKYFIDMVDTGLETVDNWKVGICLMSEFAKLGNKYADRFGDVLSELFKLFNE